MIPKWNWLTLLLLCLWFPGCKSDEGSAVSFSVITDSISTDPSLDSIIRPYRDSLEGIVSEVVGRTEIELSKGGLESTLGNMAADAMLFAIRREVDYPVEISLTNNGGLRVSISKGPITLEKMYELMPFENRMVVLTLSDIQVDSLAAQLARTGGEPVSGLSFKIDRTQRRAVDVLVDGKPLKSGKSYHLVTSDYLANGGGHMPVLWTALEKEEHALLLRDAFTQYIRAQKVIHPVLNGRITFVNP